MNLSVLIVEDSSRILKDIAILINNIGKPEREKAGIDQIRIDKADCIIAAEKLFQEAATNETPYDILILDLSLPRETGDADYVGAGLDLISKAHKQEAVRKVIIVSANFELNSHVAESFKRGAIDFIRKPYSDRELQQKVLNTAGLLSEKYLVKLSKLVDERIPVLSASVWKSSAYRFSACVYNLIQSVVYASEELRDELNRRLDLKADKGDPLLTHLAKIDEAIVMARKDFVDMQDSLKEEENRAEEVIIEHELQKLAKDLSPCIAIRSIRLVESETIALSFHNNVQTVLKEILVGGLSEAGNSTRTWRADVDVDNEKGMAAVRISDDFPPLAAQSAARINNGDSLSPQSARLREWGLALAQHIALRGGGRLIVTPREAGNLTTYLIPLA